MKTEKPCTHVWQLAGTRRMESRRKPADPAVTYGIYRCAQCPKMKTDQPKVV